MIPLNSLNTNSIQLDWLKVGSHGATCGEFAKKNRIKVYACDTEEFIMMALRGLDKMITCLEKSERTSPLFKEFEREFPLNSSKSEIALMETPGHLGVLYYDGKDKYYIDTGGIKATKESRKWLESKKKEGFKHLIVNSLPKNSKIKKEKGGEGFTFDNMSNISSLTPKSLKEIRPTI
jgi:hypothetical protein